MERLLDLEVITLFVEDVAACKAFYARALQPEVVYEDDVSCVLRFSGTMVNLLAATEAPGLIEPLPVAPPRAGVRAMITLKVSDVDAACSALTARGVAFLNGPIDRPWGRRTAAFADPAGHVWELAQVLT